jgi:hypothetical protein
LIKSQQIPLFPIVINSPHKRPNFAIRVFWTNQKVLTLLFSKFHKWSLIHWYTRLFGEPTVDRANGRQRNQRATRGLSRRLVGAPDCPVCTGHCPVSQEDRWAPDCPVRHPIESKYCLPKGFPTAPRPLGSIKGTPRRLQQEHKCSQQLYTSFRSILSLPLVCISLVCVKAKL